MRANERQARLVGFLLGTLGSVGGIGCLVTGMRLEQISLAAIGFFCAVTALITAAVAGRKLMGVAALGFVIALVWSWLGGGLDKGVEALLNHISKLYDMGYGWGVIRWSAKPLGAGMAQPALCALGVLTALGICWSFLRCRGIWLTASLLVLPVIPCMLLTDTVPATAYLFIQFLCLALLLMSRLTRKRNQETALIKLLALPVAAAVLALFICIPQKNYTSFKIVDRFLGYVQELFADTGKEEPVTANRQESRWVNLSNIGPKQQSRRVIMDVTADQSGFLYLKGAAYDTYYGTWWDSTADPLPIPLPQTDSHRVTVNTRAAHDVLYLPYGAYGISNYDGFYSEKDGQVNNPDGWHRYTVQYRQLPSLNSFQHIASDETLSAFTQLPAATRRWAAAYLARELPQLDEAELWNRAQAIIRHVSQSADYDLKTRKMPSTGKDFAQWFLEESDTGYCVHFATAATVLLRAAGIPCRYVTGYLVDAQGGRQVEVLQQSAHAWVECYIDGVGWVPLEPTPGNGISETVGIETIAPTQTVTVPQTTETTQGTEETEPTSQTGETTQSTTQTETVTEPSESSSDVGGEDPPVETPKEPVAKPVELGPVLIWLAAAVCFVAAVLGQWRLRVMLRQKKRSRGRRNAQTLALWREVVLHCRVRREEPEETLHALAQKARFSQHAITREELQVFDAWLNDSVAKLRQLSLWKRFLATVILALY